MSKDNARPAKKFYFTPVGTVGQYPYIQKPDFGTEKFPKPRGQYLIRLVVPSADAQKLVDMLNKQQEVHYTKYEENIFPAKQADAKKAGKRPPKKLDECQMPFYEDDDGNVVFTFKMHASYVDRKTNETKDLTLKVYDSKGARIFDVPAVARGSEGRVEFSVTEFVSEVAGVGLSLQLSKFQLLKLKEWTAGGDDTFGGDDLGDEYEGGYKADTFGGSDDDSDGSAEDYSGVDF